MFDYETLRLIWWAILGVLLIGFAVMDGFDLGVGAIFRFVGRNDEERRVLLETVEPVWEGNQVWFILGGGAAFAAWPLLYAAAFSGLYLALFLVLIALILRPVGFTFRGHVDDARWRNVWDWALFVGGAAPALLFGVAFGNLLLGIPFHFDELRRPVYTAGFFNLLHPFALLAGIVSLSMLVMHGATYAALKIDRSLASRAAAVGRVGALVLIVAFVMAGFWIATGIDGHRIVSEINTAGPSNPVAKGVELIRGGWLENYRAHASLWIVPGLALAMALVTERLLNRGRYGLAFLSSALAVAGVILTAGIAMFPFLMPSSIQPGHGLTIWDASSSAKTLGIMLVAVIVFLPIVLAYTSWVFRTLRGEVTLEHVRRQSGLY
ncbi:cytochrome d ubiquinol oxidase subunit II [Peristeroidobacter soli]|uniref:cytochrome d ubiquinol oxidase subunit II n=1 Tax=Peristeroidobacter soli TaxID=2497877 RepID=UPI00101E0293|nr:cytochrome d ubiquinol oxidase subunit II [Peristeroidobacter soli]